MAGPRLPKLPTEHDQLFEQDPWSAYKSTQSVANTSAPTGSHSAASAGVMQSKFQQQDDKITAVMEEVNKMKLAQPKMEENIDTRIQHVSETVEQQKISFAQQLGQMKVDL